jgi:hypothetical protein
LLGVEKKESIAFRCSTGYTYRKCNERIQDVFAAKLKALEGYKNDLANLAQQNTAVFPVALL